MTNKPDWADEIVAGLPREETYGDMDGLSRRVVEDAIAPALRKAKADGMEEAAKMCVALAFSSKYLPMWEVAALIRKRVDEIEKRGT